MKWLLVLLLLCWSASLSISVSTLRATSFSTIPVKTSSSFSSSRSLHTVLSSNSPSFANILSIRGGKVKTKNIKSTKVSTSSSSNMLLDKLNKLPPVTRFVFSFSCMLTLLSNLLSVFSSPAVGPSSPSSSVLSQYLSYISLSTFYELWRPLTFLLFHGPLSMSSVSNLYFLIIYLKNLEENFDNLLLKTSSSSSSSTPSQIKSSQKKKKMKKTSLFGLASGNTVWFLTFQLLFLNTINILFQLPFLSQAFLFSIINTVCRLKPLEKIPFQFGLIITSWQLPFALMCIEYLTNQSFSSILPHLLGIFSSHFFLFFTYIWPSLGGKKYLSTPDLFLRLFGEPHSEI